MSKQKDSEFETYTIPPNFIEGSTLFGGLFKLRNAIEAGVLAIGAGLPVFLLNIPLTTRIIVLCLTALPLALLGLFGVSGECLSSFIFAFFKWLKNRRVVDVVSEKEAPAKPVKKEKPVKKAVCEEKKSESKDKEPSMMAEIKAPADTDHTGELRLPFDRACHLPVCKGQNDAAIKRRRLYSQLL